MEFRYGRGRTAATERPYEQARRQAHAHEAHGNRLRTLALIAGVIATLLASAVGMLVAARARSTSDPKVGDILVFRLERGCPPTGSSPRSSPRTNFR